MYNNYYELVKTGIELYIKQKLEKQRNNLFNYALQQSNFLSNPELEQFEAFEYIFGKNKIDVKIFTNSLIEILTKSKHKLNTLRLWGTPNSGKTLIANCIVKPFITCYMNNHGSENEFFLSNMLNKSIILLEEIYVTVATAEDFKSILGGQPIDIAKKFNDKQLLSRTPVILTSNYELFGRGHLSPIDEKALKLRCHSFEFKSEVFPKVTLEWQQFYMYISNFV